MGFTVGIGFGTKGLVGSDVGDGVVGAGVGARVGEGVFGIASVGAGVVGAGVVEVGDGLGVAEELMLTVGLTVGRVVGRIVGTDATAHSWSRSMASLVYWLYHFERSMSFE